MGEVTFKNGKELPQKKNKKKHYWWRYLLTFLGGFLFCIGVIGGGAAIFGTVMSTREVVSMFGLDPDVYLTAQYLNDTLLNSITRLANAKFETLGDLEEVTPFIKTTIENLNTDVFEPNLHYSFDWDELKTKPFELNPYSSRPATEYDKTISLGDYIPKAIKEGVTLVSFMGDESEMDKIMKVFLYNTSRGTNGELIFGEPYSLADIIDNNVFATKMDDLRFKDIVDLGDSPFAAQMGDWTIDEFSSNPDAKIKGLKIGLLFSDEDAADNPLISTLKGKYTDKDGNEQDWTIEALTDFSNIEGLKINQILDVTDTSGLLYSIKDKSLKDLENPHFADSLLLSDIFSNPSGILGVLAERNCYQDEFDHYFNEYGNEKLANVHYFYGSGSPEKQTFANLKPRDYSTNYDGDVYLDNSTTPKSLWIYELYGWRKVTGFTVGDLNDTDKILNIKVSDVFTDYKEGDLIASFKDKTLKELSEITPEEIKIIEIYSFENITGWKKVAEEDKASVISQYAYYTSMNLATEYTGHGVPSVNSPTSHAQAEDQATNTVGDLYHDLDSDDYYIKTKEGNSLLSAIYTKNNDVTIGDLSDMDEIKDLKVSDVFTDFQEGDFISNFKDKTLQELSELSPDDIKLTEIYTLDSITGWKKVNEEDEVATVNLYDGYVADGKASIHEKNGVPTCKTPANAQVEDKDNNVIGDLCHDTLNDDYYIKVGEGNRLFSSLYEDNHDITVGDLSNFETIEGIELSAVLDAGTDPILNALFSLEDEYHNPIKVTVGNVSEKIQLLKLKDVVTVDDPDSMLARIITAVGNRKLNDLEEGFNDLTLGQIFVIDEFSPQVLQTLQGKKLSELDQVLDELTVKDVMNITVGDVYIDLDATVGEEMYIYHQDGWKQVKPADYTQEYNDYFVNTVDADNNPVLCYINSGKCNYYEGNGAPTLVEDPVTHNPLNARDTLYSVKDVLINDSDTLIDDLKNNLTLKDVCEIDDNSPEVLKQLKDTKLVDISSVIQTFTLREIIGINDSDSPVLKALADVQVFGEGDNNLEFALNHLNLFDVLDTSAFVDKDDTSKMRNAAKINIDLEDSDFDGDDLATGDIKNLCESINFDFEHYQGLPNTKFVLDKGVKKAFVDWCCSYSYNEAGTNDYINAAYHMVTGNNMDSEQIAAIKDGKFEFTYLDHKITIKGYCAKEITAQFWFLFTEDGEEFDAINERYILKEGLTYDINDMSKLTDNMTYHIQKETLFDLEEAGLLALPEGMDLTKTLKNMVIPGYPDPIVVAIPHAGEQVGSLTIKKLLEVVKELLPYISE